MADAKIFRREDPGIGNQRQQGRYPVEKGAVYYTTMTAPKQSIQPTK
jgi:hypothetical protein